MLRPGRSEMLHVVEPSDDAVGADQYRRGQRPEAEQQNPLDLLHDVLSVSKDSYADGDLRQHGQPDENGNDCLHKPLPPIWTLRNTATNEVYAIAETYLDIVAYWSELDPPGPVAFEWGEI